MNVGQYMYIRDLVKQLTNFGDPDGIPGVSQFGDFWELKAKGGVLGRINTRIYFADVGKQREIVVLHSYKKEEGGAAPPRIRVTLRHRLRLYKKGYYDTEVIRYPARNGV